MKIGLIDVDSHNFPNLATMKISAYHKSIGDTVEWWMPFDTYDMVYKSKVFTFTPDIDTPINADTIVRGGTGYDLQNKLPQEIESMQPDYSLYPQYPEAYMFLTRGCPNNCEFCIVSKKEGRCSKQVADLKDFTADRKVIKLLDPNLLACKDREKILQQLAESKSEIDFTQSMDARFTDADITNLINKINVKEIHFAWDLMAQSESVLKGLKIYAKHAKRKPHGFYATVYVLVNFNTTLEENLYRIYKLREMKYNPYVMVYDKEHAPEEVLNLQRWVNNRKIWNQCKAFEDYGKAVNV